MNAGIIASRYAKAFLKFVEGKGTGEKVYSQVCTLVRLLNELPQLKAYIENPSDISVDRKTGLLSAGLEAPLDASIVRFLKMVTAHRRIEYFPRMLLSFIEQYRKENNIKVGQIVAATPNEGLSERLENIFHDMTVGICIVATYGRIAETSEEEYPATIPDAPHCFASVIAARVPSGVPLLSRIRNSSRFLP